MTVTTQKFLQFTLQTEGYGMLYIHSNSGKSVSAASNVLDNNYIVPTRLQHCRESVLFHAHPGRDEALFFTDEWEDRIIDYIDFQLVLTFDFAPSVFLPEPNTIQELGELDL